MTIAPEQLTHYWEGTNQTQSIMEHMAARINWSTEKGDSYFIGVALNKKIFVQRVYTNAMISGDLHFHEYYKYEWYPPLAFDAHYIPVPSSITTPASREYNGYVCTERFLLEVQVEYYNSEVLAKHYQESPNLQECQGILFSLLENVHMIGEDML